MEDIPSDPRLAVLNAINEGFAGDPDALISRTVKRQSL